MDARPFHLDGRIETVGKTCCAPQRRSILFIHRRESQQGNLGHHICDNAALISGSFERKFYVFGWDTFVYKRLSDATAILTHQVFVISLRGSLEPRMKIGGVQLSFGTWLKNMS